MTRGGECIGDDHTVHVHSVDFQNVEFHVGQLGELPQTELTRVRPLARVTQHVSAQFGRSDEPFAAKIALMFVMWGQGYTVLVILRGGHLDNDRDQCGYECGGTVSNKNSSGSVPSPGHYTFKHSLVSVTVQSHHRGLEAETIGGRGRVCEGGVEGGGVVRPDQHVAHLLHARHRALGVCLADVDLKVVPLGVGLGAVRTHEGSHARVHHKVSLKLPLGRKPFPTLRAFIIVRFGSFGKTVTLVGLAKKISQEMEPWSSLPNSFVLKLYFQIEVSRVSDKKCHKTWSLK